MTTLAFIDKLINGFVVVTGKNLFFSKSGSAYISLLFDIVRTTTAVPHEHRPFSSFNKVPSRQRAVVHWVYLKATELHCKGTWRTNIGKTLVAWSLMSTRAYNTFITGVNFFFSLVQCLRLKIFFVLHVFLLKIRILWQKTALSFFTPPPPFLSSGICMDTSRRRRTITWRPPCVWVVRECYLASDWIILINV